MGTHDPERRSRTLSSATSLVPLAPSSFSSAPFHITKVKREEGAGSPVFAVLVPIGLQRGKEACLGIREEGAAAVSLCWGRGSCPVFTIEKRGRQSQSQACERGLGDGRAVEGCGRELDETRQRVEAYGAWEEGEDTEDDGVRKRYWGSSGSAD